MCASPMFCPLPCSFEVPSNEAFASLSLAGRALAPAKKTSRSGNPWVAVVMSWALVQVSVPRGPEHSPLCLRPGRQPCAVRPPLGWGAAAASAAPSWSAGTSLGEGCHVRVLHWGLEGAAGSVGKALGAGAHFSASRSQTCF